MNVTAKQCPCGSGRAFADCCEPYVTGAKQPPTAEALMRSRYAAYAEHFVEYIVETCTKDNKNEIDVKETKEWSEKSRWLGLKVFAIDKGAESDTEGSVEFEATYERDGLKDVHHEKARFKKREGKWYYDEGDIVPKTIVRAGPKIGRNDLCSCGSGKKYKHCHGKA
ncbi:MAG: YchJ family protein [Treponema sp.]|jgi:SEC-C motif-containing protein|nr:YchJ family protein [Treponema sp.]